VSDDDETKTEAPTLKDLALEDSSGEDREGLTQIVSQKADPSVFDTATVIRPSDDSTSEVTRYFKEIKSQAAFGEIPRLEAEPPPEQRSPASDRRSGDSLRVREDSTLVREKNRRPSGRLSDAPPWVFGVGALIAVIILLALSTLQKIPAASAPQNEAASVVSRPTKSAASFRLAGTQLKIEFLSDLHKNMEETKAHAPLY
jgi:hypothetical protein